MKKIKLSRKEKKNLIRILVALSMFFVILIVDKTIGLATSVGGKYGWLLPFFLYFAVYMVIGYDVLYKAGRGVFHGQVLDENLLMCVASLGAGALGVCIRMITLSVARCRRHSRNDGRSDGTARSPLPIVRRNVGREGRRRRLREIPVRGRLPVRSSFSSSRNRAG